MVSAGNVPKQVTTHPILESLDLFGVGVLDLSLLRFQFGNFVLERLHLRRVDTIVLRNR